MRKLVRATLLLMCGILGGALLHAQSVSHHSTNLKVYVEPLNGSNADLDRSIRSRLIDDFVRHGIFVVESEESADAILTGSALTQSTFGTSIGRRPNMRIRGSMRLFNSKGVALRGSLAEHPLKDGVYVAQLPHVVERAVQLFLA